MQGKILQFATSLSAMPQRWTNFQDAQLQNCWCVCIIFTSLHDPHLMKFCQKYQNPSSGHWFWRNLPLTDLFSGIKSVSLTTNMVIFRKIITPSSHLSKDVSLLIYVRYLAKNLIVEVRGLYTRFFKNPGQLRILQKLLHL